jgi:hypothetical protein
MMLGRGRVMSAPRPSGPWSEYEYDAEMEKPQSHPTRHIFFAALE